MNYAADSAHVAWAAGVFDGEGTICISQNKLSVHNTDLDLLEKFMHVVGCGKIVERRKSQLGKKRIFMWRCCRKSETLELLRAFLPWLCARRAAKATEYFEYANRPHKSTSGARNGNSKLTVAQVVEILKSNDKPIRISERYGVTLTNILSIRNRQTWRSVNVV
jgi:hypothetical protein